MVDMGPVLIAGCAQFVAGKGRNLGAKIQSLIVRTFSLKARGKLIVRAMS